MRRAAARCHVPGGPAAELALTRVTKDEEWLLGHVADPVAIAPGVRSAEDPAPTPQFSTLQAQAIVAYLRRMRAAAQPPIIDEQDRSAALTFVNACAACHSISGEGGNVGPDLSEVGRRRNSTSLQRIVSNPASEFPNTRMPAYGARLTADQMEALVQYLSKRR